MRGGDTGVAHGGENVAADSGEHAGGDDAATVGTGVKGDPSEAVEEEDVGPADVESAVQGVPAATSATASETSWAAIG